MHPRLPLLLALLLPHLAGAQEEPSTPSTPSTPPADSAPGEDGAPPWNQPDAARALLTGVAGTMFVGGAVVFLGLGDSFDAGDPQGTLVGGGLIGLGGVVVGLVADLVTPRPAVPVRDVLRRPTLRLALLPEGSSRSARYTLDARLDPRILLSPDVALHPHLGFAGRLGDEEAPDPRPQAAGALALRSRRLQLSAGAELAFLLPPLRRRDRAGLAGRVELRWRPLWELRRRTLHPGEPQASTVEQSALYPATLGVRWHLTPRQRVTLYVGPRLDWVGTEPLPPGSPPLVAFHGEVWWQLDIPLVRSARGLELTSRLNLGYVHSKLNGQRLDVGAIVGYFGPVEISTDLRFRKPGSPVALQLGAGARIAVGGGPFVTLGLVTPTLGARP